MLRRRKQPIVARAVRGTPSAVITPASQPDEPMIGDVSAEVVQLWPYGSERGRLRFEDLDRWRFLRQVNELSRHLDAGEQILPPQPEAS